MTSDAAPVRALIERMIRTTRPAPDQEAGDNPYPELARLRHEAFVHARGPAIETYGHDVIVVGFDEAQSVLRDAARFCTTSFGLLESVIGRTILEMDGSAHRTYRAFVQQAFTRNAIARWEDEIIRPVVDAAIERLDGHTADLVGDFTFPVPFAVIAGMLGLESDGLDDLHRLAVDLISARFDQQSALEASKQLKAALLEVIADRRRRPRDDIVSALAHARGPGRRLTNEEILSFLLLLLPAGGETSFRSTGTLLWALLDQPLLLDAVRADRSSLLHAAIEEGLRWETPVVNVTRVAVETTAVGGVEVEAGRTVCVCLGSANRDERYWDNPEVFDLTRETRPALSFGTGPHVCIGLHLVRRESVIMVERLLDRFPHLRRDPDQPWPQIGGTLFRSPPRVPVLLD